MWKICAFTLFALAGCKPAGNLAADLDEAKQASAAFCQCTKQPARLYGECSKAAYPRWQTIDGKLKAVTDADEKSKATLADLETETTKCKAIGDEVWRFIKNAKLAAPAPPQPGQAPAPGSAPTAAPAQPAP